MKKRVKNKIENRKEVFAGREVPAAENNMGVQAASFFTPERNFPLWGSLDPKQEISNWQLETIWRRARGLYANSPEIRNAVKQLVLLSGYILPLPNTRDKEFNEAARRAFMRRAMNPRLFETSGRLNFLQTQKWLEERAIIDGDCLTVLTRLGAEKGGAVALYSAPQVTGEKPNEETLRTGCVCGRSGRVLKYLVKEFNTNEIQEIPASRCVMYTHTPDPADPRTVSELLAGICTCKDIDDINRLHKQQVKLASLFGLIETKDINDKRSGLNDLIQKRHNSSQNAGAATACKQPEQPLYIDGVKAISLEPGRELKTLDSRNPSNEVRAFVKDLIRNLAYSLGIDPELLYDVNSLGSGAIRFSLAKAKDWARIRNYDREVWANRVYQHIIANEIEEGRLAPCKYAEDTYNVTWIMRNHWSIDLRHEAQAFIALYSKGLTTGDVWTLANYGLTFEDVMKKRAEEFATAKMIAEDYGLPVDLLIPNELGGTPVDWDNVDEDAKAEDNSPETEGDET